MKTSTLDSTILPKRRYLIVLALLLASAPLFVPTRANAAPAAANRNVSPISGLASIDVEHGVTKTGGARTFHLELRVRLDGSESEMSAMVDGVSYQIKLRAARAQARVVTDFKMIASSNDEAKRAQMKVKAVSARGKKILLGESRTAKGKNLSVSLTLDY